MSWIRFGGLLVSSLVAVLLWTTFTSSVVATSTTPGGVELATVSSGVSQQKLAVSRSIGREVGATMRVEVVDRYVCLPATDQLRMFDEMFIILVGEYELIENDGNTGIRLLDTSRPVDGPGQYTEDDVVDVFEGETFDLEQGGRIVSLTDGTEILDLAASTRERCGFSDEAKFLLVSAPRLPQP